MFRHLIVGKCRSQVVDGSSFVGAIASTIPHKEIKNGVGSAERSTPYLSLL